MAFEPRPGCVFFLRFSSLLLTLLFLGACGGGSTLQKDLRAKAPKGSPLLVVPRAPVEPPALPEGQDPSLSEEREVASLPLKGMDSQEPPGSPGWELGDTRPSPFEDDLTSRLPLPSPEGIPDRTPFPETGIPPPKGDAEVLEPLDIPLAMNAQVERYLDHFRLNNRSNFKRWLENSGRYMPMIRQVLREEGLPEDLAYLALIESGFNPKAYSWAGASGLWQFMPRTGRKYGLVIDWWIDERRDPVKSTRAAARYLKDLYALFRSWHLAQAGYNAGEAKILTGLSRVRGNTFWSLARSPHIPAETRNFVPRLIAATRIAKDPEAYGFVDLRIQEPIQFEEVHVPRAMELRSIAKASGIPLEEIRDLNLDLRRGVTPPNYPGYHLKVPKGTGARVAAAVRALKPPSASAERYVIRPGDTLGAIASAFGTTVEALVTLNAIPDPSRIQVGREIFIPSGHSRPTGPPPPAKREAHVVREGETLWGIARTYGLSLADLLRINGLNPQEPIRPGDRILLRGSEPTALP